MTYYGCVLRGGSLKKDKTGEVLEYFEDELEDSVLKSVINRCYSLFYFFNGRINGYE